MERFKASFQKEEAASALLEIGEPAVPYLVPLLDDFEEAILEGSEEATVSADSQYRRADWACLFISLIRDIPYRFHEDPAVRDKRIRALKNRLTLDPRK